MAGDRRRGSDDKDPLFEDEEESAPPQGGPGAVARGDEEAEGRGSIEEEDETSPRLRFNITLRRIKIDPDKKRAQYIRRLERLMKKLDKIIVNPDGVEKIQLSAMKILIKAIHLCYGIVSDVEVEVLEEEVEELKRREKEVRKEELGYEIEPEEEAPP